VQRSTQPKYDPRIKVEYHSRSRENARTALDCRIAKVEVEQQSSAGYPVGEDGFSKPDPGFMRFNSFERCLPTQ